MKTVDDAIAALSAGIAAAETEGADPTKLKAADDAVLNLGAVREALLDQKARELDRFARVRGELTAVATGEARAVLP